MKCPKCKEEITITSTQLDKEIYGTGGLYNRIYDKIRKIGPTAASKMSGKSRQHMWELANQYTENPYQTKLETLTKTAKKLGVE